jgi:uncharacterized membrane protein
MAAFFSSLNRTILAGVVITLVMMGVAGTFGRLGDHGWCSSACAGVHIGSGVMWIGPALVLQTSCRRPSMPQIPDEQKPAVSKVIAPRALFWFRWAALATVVTGLLVAAMNPAGYLVGALTLAPGYRAIGVGVWLALIMAFNVWFIIWPNQKRRSASSPSTPTAKAAAAKLAGMTSRINTMLSIPMLYCMAAQFARRVLIHFRQ